MQNFTFETWLNIVSVSVGLIGVALACYFYRRSILKPVPVYGTHPLRARIVNESEMKTRGFSVLYDGRPIESNVTATTLYFWNEGRMPIRKADVLRAFTITPAEESTFLQWQIVSVSREACGFSLSPSPSSGMGNASKLVITFDVMEEGDGVAIQIIHAGDPDADLSLSGVSIGARSLARNDLDLTAVQTGDQS